MMSLKLSFGKTLACISALTLMACGNSDRADKNSISISPENTETTTVEVTPANPAENLTPGLYIKNEGTFSSLPRYDLSERAEISSSNASSMMRYLTVSGTIPTIPADQTVLLKGSPVDRISLRAIDVDKKNVDLLFAGDNGKNSSFGHAQNENVAYKITQTDNGLTAVAFLEPGDYVLTLRLSGTYSYVPLKAR